MNLGAPSENREKSANPKNVKPPSRPASHREKPVAQFRKKIQAIDLSHSRDQTDYGQHGPREYRKLHRLHDNVNKGLSVAIIGAKTPTFSYAAGLQPQISFLNRSVRTSKPNDKPSSDYDDGWMDDLPSPSSLLDNNRSKSKRLLEGNIYQAADEVALDGDSSPRPADHEDDDYSATISNDTRRKTIDLDNRRCAADQREMENLPLPELPIMTFGQWDGIKSIESDDRLFCSVDSRPQTISPLEKRKLAAGPESPRPKEKLGVERRSRTVSPQISGDLSKDDFHKAKKRRVSDSPNKSFGCHQLIEKVNLKLP